jgi:hypothetical protein
MSPEEAIAEALESHRYTAFRGVCPCGFRFDIRCEHNAHVAEAVLSVLTTNGWALVPPPSIAFKGPRDTDASMFLVAADKAESAKYPVGGSNVGRAVADILRQVAAAVSPTQRCTCAVTPDGYCAAHKVPRHSMKPFGRGIS